MCLSWFAVVMVGSSRKGNPYRCEYWMLIFMEDYAAKQELGGTSA
jgi:hypothetical protein